MQYHFNSYSKFDIKKSWVLLVGILCSFQLFSQVYISTSTGYAVGSAEQKLGEIITPGSTENSYGSYGEGVNFQVSVGYFFNSNFGVNLGLGFLRGDDQIVSKVISPLRELNAMARGRAFAVSPSLVYKFTNNLYGRFGALIKAGGKTEAIVFNKVVFSDTEAAALSLPLGAYSETNYIEDFHGKLPLGFTGALGYKYKLNSTLGLFLEIEYFGISIKRNDSEIVEFNTDFFNPDGSVAVQSFYSIDNLPAGVSRKTTYVDNLPNNNMDASKKLAQRVPYSSFGINFGITFTFKSKSAKN